MVGGDVKKVGEGEGLESSGWHRHVSIIGWHIIQHKFFFTFDDNK